MHPLVDILGQAMGTLRPWRFADPAPLPAEIGPQPFRSLHGVFAGVPLTLRVHHQLDPADRDNHALHWHRISLGTEGGVLALADTHGPVLWSPRLHIDRDGDRRFVLDGPGTGRLGLGTTAVVGSTGTFRTVFSDLWPEAIGSALDGLREAVAQGGDALRAGQYDLAVCRIWTDLAARLGPPEIVRPGTPRPLAVSDVFPAPAGFPQDAATRSVPASRPGDAHPGPTGEPARRPSPPEAGSPRPADIASYSPSAEFFDLVAAQHTATASAPAIAALLADADLSAGPVVDIGAGTGLVTEAVARARPDAEIIACEPSVGMRAVLTSRVFSDEDLRKRVTVTADAAPELDLPDRISVVLLCGVLGHLDAEGRARLWRRLSERLVPGGLVVVELMQFAEPLALPETRLATATAGHHRYEWSFGGAPDTTEDGVMRLHSTWRVYRDGAPQVEREVHDSYRWEPFGLKDVVVESGMTARTLSTRSGAPRWPCSPGHRARPTRLPGRTCRPRGPSRTPRAAPHGSPVHLFLHRRLGISMNSPETPMASSTPTEPATDAVPKSAAPPRDFPIQRGCPFAPPAEYDALRTHDPVARVTLPTKKEAWVVARYDDVRELLSDPGSAPTSAGPTSRPRRGRTGGRGPVPPLHPHRRPRAHQVPAHAAAGVHGAPGPYDAPRRAGPRGRDRGRHARRRWPGRLRLRVRQRRLHLRDL